MIFTALKDYVNSVNLSYCSWGHLFKLLSSAALKLRRWQKHQEQKKMLAQFHGKTVREKIVSLALRWREIEV